MLLNGFEWSLIGGAAALAIALITYFLKRTMATTDEHGVAINKLKQTCVTKEEIRQHEKDINHIKQTYVTKDEMKEMRTELKADIEKLSATVNAIQKTTLPKEDFYRSQMETHRQLEKVEQLLLERLGGG